MQGSQPLVFNSNFYKTAVGVADHYGFRTLDSLKQAYPSRIKGLPKVDREDLRIDALGGEFVKSMRTCLSHNMLLDNTPKLFYHMHGIDSFSSKKDPRALFGLQVVGIKSGIAEATILKTALNVLSEVNAPAKISINSVGDFDSAARFKREITNYLRRNINELSGDEQQLMKDDPVQAYRKAAKRVDTIAQSAPRPVEFLSKDSRRHFREVLESLESTDIPYDIDDSLTADPRCYSQVVFQISQEIEDPQTGKTKSFVIAKGGRFDEMARKLFKSIAPAVGIIFNLPREKKDQKLSSNHRRPKLGFVHIGMAAQRHSLGVTESLRRARIPVTQQIGSPSLSEQLKYVKQYKVPQILIMGQKEVNEGTVILRNTETSAQQIIPQISVIQYLKGTV